MNTLSMYIQGQPVPYGKVDITFDRDQLAHTFQASIIPRVISSPLEVEFFISGTRIFQGAIDTVADDVGSGQHTLSISGRSRSAAMIDSTITMDALYGQTIDKLLRRIAGQFAMPVRCDVAPSSLKAIDEFQINAESPVDNLAQLAREQGLILIERDGTLALERLAHKPLDGIALEVGLHVEKLSLQRNFSKQYSEIEVRGQWSDAHAVVKYAPANKYRRRVIVSDQLQDAKSCQTRAAYERDLAIAQGNQASTVIPGIFPEFAGGAINRTVLVISDVQGIREPMLVKSLTLSVSETSAQTSVQLCRPFEEKQHV